ncbi:phosphate-binding protein, partial [Enterococcus faecalis]|nr:phosphate-binding protein [Enterococcus faecalis]
NVSTNDWPIWAYEHMYTKGEPTELTKEFMEYMMSEDVQTGIVPTIGYISINDMQVTKDAQGNVTAHKE